MTAIFDEITGWFQFLLRCIGTFLNNLLTAPTGGAQTLYVVMPFVALAVAYGIVKFGMGFVYRFIPGLS